MLVCTMKKNEEFIIEVDGLDIPIKIMAVNIGQGRVKIGFIHPDNEAVRFYRDEVYQRVLAERKKTQKGG